MQKLSYSWSNFDTLNQFFYINNKTIKFTKSYTLGKRCINYFQRDQQINQCVLVLEYLWSKYIIKCFALIKHTLIYIFFWCIILFLMLHNVKKFYALKLWNFNSLNMFLLYVHLKGEGWIFYPKKKYLPSTFHINM